MGVLGSKKKLLHHLFTSVPCSSSILRFISRQAHGSSLVILSYHQIVETFQYGPDWCCLTLHKFSEQMKYLSKHFEVVALSDGITSLKNKQNKGKPLAAITFDDGFQNNYQYAFPILKKLQMPATIFLATGFVDSEQTLWSCRLNKALYESTVPEIHWNGKSYRLGSLQDKTDSFRRLQVELKKLPNNSLLEQCRHIVKLVGGDMDELVAKDSIYRMLDRVAIDDMVCSGLIEFGAHTHDHVILSRVSQREQRRQINESVSFVRKITGVHDIVFAYPNGTRIDYNHTSIAELEAAGIHYAVTTTSGINHHSVNPLELKRVGIGGDWPFGLFKFAIHTGLTTNI